MQVVDERSFKSSASFHRTPRQVLLLDISTFGFYMIYYLIYNFRLTEKKFHEKRLPGWARFSWLLPIVNAYTIPAAFSQIGKRAEASGVKLRMPFGMQALVLVALSNLGILPGIWSLLGFTSVIMLAHMHASVARAETIDFPYLEKPKLTKCEIGIITIGLLFVSLGVVGKLLSGSQLK